LAFLESLETLVDFLRDPDRGQVLRQKSSTNVVGHQLEVGHVFLVLVVRVVRPPVAPDALRLVDHVNVFSAEIEVVLV